MSPPHSRLFLKLLREPAEGSPLACVEAALEAGDIAALLIGAKANATLRECAKGLVSVSQERDVAILVQEDAQLARDLGADGVHLTGDLDDFKVARDILGSDAIIGVSANFNRHLAMELAEAGASYVGFLDDPRDPEAISVWWAAVMEIPSVIEVPVEQDFVVSAVEAGIEFVMPDESMWASSLAAAESVAKLDAFIAGVSVGA